MLSPLAPRVHRVVLLFFYFNWHQCGSHQRLLLFLRSEAQVYLMQIMLIWTLIIYSSFLNGIFNTADF